MRKNKHILIFALIMAILMIFFSWMYLWLQHHSSGIDFGALGH